MPGRQAAPLSRAHPQPLSHGHARRVAVHRQHRSDRPGVSRRRARAGAAHRARLDLRSSVLDRRRGPQRARSAALALHRGGARLRGRPRGRGAGSARPANPARERLELFDVPLLGDDRVGIPRARSRAAPIAISARHQQHLRERRESRLRRLALSARRPEGARAPVPSGRSQRHGRSPDRHARSSDRGAGMERSIARRWRISAPCPR